MVGVRSCGVCVRTGGGELLNPVADDVSGVGVGEFAPTLGAGSGADTFLASPLLPALDAIFGPVGMFCLEWSLHLKGK